MSMLKMLPKQEILEESSNIAKMSASMIIENNLPTIKISYSNDLRNSTNNSGLLPAKKQEDVSMHHFYEEDPESENDDDGETSHIFRDDPHAGLAALLEEHNRLQKIKMEEKTKIALEELRDTCLNLDEKHICLTQTKDCERIEQYEEIDCDKVEWGLVEMHMPPNKQASSYWPKNQWLSYYRPSIRGY